MTIFKKPTPDTSLLSAMDMREGRTAGDIAKRLNMPVQDVITKLKTLSKVNCEYGHPYVRKSDYLWIKLY